MKRDDEPSRLSDHGDLDPWIGGLLRSQEPYRAAPGRKQRLLLGLGRSERPRAPFFLRAGVVAVVLVGCGAFASAAIGPWRGWIGRAVERLAPRAAPAVTPVISERPHVHRPGPVEPAQAVVTLSPPPPPPRAPSVPARIHHAVAVSSPPASSPAPARAEQDTELVADGLRALRLDHDSPHARALLGAYLARHPGGALAEEALALTIEAAVAHHDADAAALGARYLQKYPSGPFRALALQAELQNGPSAAARPASR